MITLTGHSDSWAGAQENDLACQIEDALAVLATVEASFEANRQCLLEWSGPDVLKKRFLKQLEMRQAQQRAWLVQKLVELHHRTAMLSLVTKSHRVR